MKNKFSIQLSLLIFKGAD